MQDPAADTSELSILVRPWTALPQPSMRFAALCRYLRGVGDARAVFTLHHVIGEAFRRNQHFMPLYAGMVDPDACRGALGGDRAQALYQQAQGPDYELALQWLYTLVSPQDFELQGDTSSQTLIHRTLRDLSLGERRALARRCRGDVLAKVLTDPDPAVIHNLLNNGSCTERTVLAICSQRPALPAPLVCVLQHQRWNGRYDVRLALAQNPYLPQRYAINLLPQLRPSHVGAIARDEVLGEVLRLAAQRLLRVVGEGDTA